MVSKVKLTYSVEVFVKHDTEEELTDWMNTTTPEEAAAKASKNGAYIQEDYSEELLCRVMDNSDFDIAI